MGVKNPASLTISRGGTVTAPIANIGTNERGTATITGAGSRWYDFVISRVGWNAEGVLTITDSGAMSGKDMVLGANDIAQGTINLSGSGSKLALTGALTVGGEGTGILNLSGGGTVEAVSGVIGAAAGSSGKAIVSGVGTTWTSTGGVLAVGDRGDGVLTLADSANVVADDRVDIARESGSTGTLIIGAAAGETAAAAGTLQTGAIVFGAGDGSIVFNHTESAYSFAPDISGAGGVDVYSGTTILTGTNTYTGGTRIEGGTLRAGAPFGFADNTAYTVNGGMLDLNGHDLTMSKLSGTGGTVGLGTATLTVSQDADTTFAGSFSGSGTLALDGPGRLELTGTTSAYSGDVRVASGTLEINNAFSSGSGFIGTVAGEDGRVDVTGPAALWTLNGDLDVGRTGSGALVISGGGGVEASGKIAVGSASLSLPKGSITVTGEGSRLSTGTGGALTIGSIAGSTLAVEDGGAVTSGTATLGQSAWTRGTATVSGTGSLWTTGSMKIGSAGATGVLTVADGGKVRATDTFSIGSNGTLNIGAAAGDTAVAAGNVDTLLIDFGTGSGKIVFNHTDTDYTFFPDIKGAGSIEAYSGTTTLFGNNIYTGETRVEGGILRAGSLLAFAQGGTYTVNGGVLDLNGNDLMMSRLSGTGGTVGLGTARLSLSQDADTEYGGSFTGSGTLAFFGPGRLRLTGATSAYSGDIRVASGTLEINNAFASGSGYIGTVADEAGRVDVTGPSALWKLNGDLYVGRTGSGTVVISDGGGVNASGKIAVGSASFALPSGSITVTGTGSRLSTGTGGSLVIGSITGSTLAVDNGGAVTSGTATLGQSAWTRGTATVSGTGSLWTTGSMKVGSAGATGVMTVAEGGTVRATDAFSIGTQGRLNIGAAAGETAVAAGVVDTGLIDFGTRSGKIVFNHTDTDYAFAPAIAGAGSVEVYSGMTILAGNNSYSGGTTVEGGILRAGAASAFAQDTAYTVNGGMLDLDGHDLTMSALSGTGGTVGLGTGRLTVSQDVDTLFAGKFTGSGMLTLSGTGRLRLTGPTSAYSGNVRVVSGTLEINNMFASEAGVIGAGAGDIGQVDVTGPAAAWLLNGDLNVGRNGSGALAISDGGGVNASGNIAVGTTAPSFATGQVTVAGSGSRLSTGAGGSLIIGALAGSTLAIEEGGAVDSATATLGQAGWARGSATVSGTGSLWTTGTMNVGGMGAGTLTVADGGTVRAANAFAIGTQGVLNIGAAAGETAVAAGVVDTSLIDFGTGSGKIVFNHTNPDYTFAPDITGAGGVEVYSGTTILTGKSSYTGGTDVFGGKLVVNGITGAVNVSAAAMLAGSGTVGDTVVSGMVAPGNSIGTMHVAGDLGLGAGAVYQVEVNDAGTDAGINNDLITVAGAASIDKGANLVVLADRSGDTGAGYDPVNVYTVVTAEGGVTGGFGSVSDNFAFLDSYLGYDATNVYLTLQRNDADFVDGAITPNQKATAEGLESLSPDTALYRAILGLYENEAPEIFDALSGEIHASANTVLRDQPKQVERAILSRIDAAFATDGAEGAAQTGETLAAEGVSVWFDALGGRGRYQGDGNAHTVDTSGGGALFGGDVRVDQDWLFGLAAGYMNASIEEKGFTASADTDSYYVGGYGSTQTGPFSFSFGGSYGHHAISTKRSVSFVGLSEQLDADYDARTLQAFAETGWRFGDEAGYLQPFAAASYVNLKTDGFSETGGMAALHAASQMQDLWTTTLGLRASRDIMLGETAARLSGHAGWQHAYGDLNGTSMMAFNGGSDFGISGVPTARDAALLGVGLSFDLSNEASLSLGYEGQLAEGVQDHNFSMRFDLRF
ncbi:autotransporter domain-containing protein [Martelella limonii]|uniref:autotransporter domain-containing protein n=1 Tax=Martelella limonii TaxID=1647649 RepID=UPI00158092CF